MRDNFYTNWKKIAFHPLDLKSHGVHLGLYRDGMVSRMPYDLPDDLYTNDQPIRVREVIDHLVLEQSKAYVFVLNEIVVVEDTCEELGRLCIVIPQDKIETIAKPL